MSEFIDPPLSEYDVACHTIGCSNAESVIRVMATVEDPFVLCGVCNERITDVVPVDG